jgi:membrane-bound metal-dependent hydrolase YbcI (DUF457 family)
MCTGPTHATQGAIVGLAIPALYPTILGYTPTTPAILLGAVLSAGGALLPDLDMSCSTASNSFGPITDVVSHGVQGLSRVAFRLTATAADRKRTKGTHRGLTHTGIGAGLVCAGMVALTSLGITAALAVVFAVAFLALRGLPPVAKNITDLITAAGITGATYLVLAHQSIPGWWIGAAIGVGCLAHQAGDAMTTRGIPFLWPLPLGGRTWRPLGMPRWMRFETGECFETGPLKWANLAALAALLVNLTPVGHRGIFALLHSYGPAS